MKINRFIALALIAVLAIATMGFFSVRVLAQSPKLAPPAQDCEEDDANEGEEECGNQDEDESEEAEDAAEGPDVPITGSALDQASAAALDYLGEGRVTGTEVGDEEGYYEIEVTLDNGNQVDVHLDENFNVLSQVSDED